MTIDLSIEKCFTLIGKVPSKVNMYSSFRPKIAGLVEYA